MRVLLDECMPRRLKHELARHVVRTVQEMGWAGVRDGTLLQLASAPFDVVLTVDQGIQYQQNVSNLMIGVVVLAGASNDIDTYGRCCRPSRMHWPECSRGRWFG